MLMEESYRKSTRIHVPLRDQKLPVIFSYNQLFKREHKEIESFVPLDNNEDSFYTNILKKAESYVPSDDDDASDDENLPIGKKSEDYDFADPFIDDSEMLMEEPEDYVLPEYDGFFVYQGPLDGSEGNTNTEKKQTSRKTNNTKGKSAAASSTTKKTDTKTSRSVKKTGEDTKTKKPATTTTTTATTNGSTSKTTSDQTNKKASTTTAETKKSTAASTSSNSTTTSAASKKKSAQTDKEDASAPDRVDLSSSTDSESGSAALKKTTSSEMEPLDDDVEELMNTLRRDVKPEMFETKSKFPSILKPTVFKIGLILLRKYKTIDENLITHMMAILPYNRYTLKKLLATKSGQMRIDELQQEIDEMAIQLKRKIDSMMPEQIKLYNEKVALHQKEKQDQGEGSSKDEDGNDGGGEVEKKFRCNEEVRKLLYEIMKADEQSVAVTNLIATITKKTDLSITEGKARKMMYQRLLSCWPEGWMNSYEMSRQYSQYKAKITPAKSKATTLSTPSSSQSTKSTPAPERKRKRATPQSSPDEPARKKTIVTSETRLPSPLKLNQTPNNTPNNTQDNTQTNGQNNYTIIDLENDEETEQSYPQQQQPSSSSMKIESLISGPK